MKNHMIYFIMILHIHLLSGLKIGMHPKGDAKVVGTGDEAVQRIGLKWPGQRCVRARPTNAPFQAEPRQVGGGGSLSM